MDILNHLEAVILERRNADPEESYVASLHARGLNKILEKVGEEATEVILAAKDAAAATGPDRAAADVEVVKETADLWFHSLVLLGHLGVGLQSVLAELERREGVSGHQEKAARRP